MNQKNSYNSFDQYVLRTPLFSLSSYIEFTSKKHISDNDFKTLCRNKTFKEALFLASPQVYETAEKWLNNQLNDPKKVDRLKMTLLKYYSRMSSRCTPFGLFAGCSVGRITNATKILLKSVNHHKRQTRLDMHFLFSLAKHLSEIEPIKQQLLFFPNTSIYQLGGHLRYVEYSYTNNKREHHISSVDHSDYLAKILETSKPGARLSDLAQTIVADDVSLEEAEAFIEELVENQLLISELEPTISGDPCFDQVLKVLTGLTDTEVVVDILKEVQAQLKAIDNAIGNPIAAYKAISERLKTIAIEFDSGALFQTDMITATAENTLDKSLIFDIKKGIALLNKMALPSKDGLLSAFKDEFYERYENREMPLSAVLDTEVGIGYRQDHSGDINPLIDGFHLKSNDQSLKETSIKWTPLHTMLQKKITEAYKNRAYCMTILDDDLKDLTAEWDDLPDTIAFEIEIINIDGNEKVKLNGGGLSCAANLMGRFCHGDQQMHNLVKTIVDVEKQINDNTILAEIVHLPESKVGNIIMRPDFREFEIPYMSRSIKPENQQLLLEDLTISVKHGKQARLRSKKHNKDVIPRLTNAHNYSFNALPVYQFLCDLQTQNKRDQFYFSFGPLASNYEFLPRVEYRNLILHSATWHLNRLHIEDSLRHKNDDDQLLSKINALRADLHLPKYVLLIEGDNQLLINLENITSIRMFLAEVEKKPRFKLKEFLFAEGGIAKHSEEVYTNQIIMPFFNSKKLNHKLNTLYAT